ncbi:hypothetical protein ACFE04_009858 [Oxalis oulophora]
MNSKKYTFEQELDRENFMKRVVRRIFYGPPTRMVVRINEDSDSDIITNFISSPEIRDIYASVYGPVKIPKESTRSWFRKKFNQIKKRFKRANQYPQGVVEVLV